MAKSETVGTLEKYTPRYWKSEIQLAEERHKKFFDRSEESIKLYRAERDLNNVQRRLNVWWYCVNTLLPAYYSSTPKAQAKLRKRAGGMAAELGAVVLERNVQYALDEYFDFDAVGYNAALSFLLTGRAVLWARYDCSFETEVTEIALIRTPDGNLADQSGAIFDVTQEGIEIIEPTDGTEIVTVRIQVEKKDDEKALLEVIAYNDFLTNDARNESEIEWVARRAFLDKAAARKIFGVEAAEKLSYDAFPEAIQRDWRRDREAYEGKAEVFEIWCKATERVYWMQQNGDRSIIQEGEPPVEFEGFFPCSVISQSVDPDSVIPVSDYVHCKDQILQIERLTTRIAAVVEAIRTNALYDATMGTQVEQLLQGDLKFIPVMNWPSYKGRGGGANGVEYFDVSPFINALQVLGEARANALGQLYETLKVSDLLRGASDPSKTATANRLESAWSSLGLIVRQNQFAKFVSDGINKLSAIIAEMFDPAVIMDVADADALIGPMIPEPEPSEDPNMPPPDPQLMIESIKAQIYEVISDDEQRAYRIEVSSDSMVALDQQREKAEGLEMIESVSSFFQQMSGMIEQYPPLANFSMALLQNVVRRYKGGEELDGMFQSALATITKITEAREAAAAQQEPPPDPNIEQIQANLQIASMDAQLRNQEIQNKAYFDQESLLLKNKELELKNAQLQVEMMRIQAQSDNEMSKQEITKENNRVNNILDLQRLELERMATRLAESEKMLEERRLADEQELERIRIALRTMQETPVAAPKPAGRKVGKIISDETGNPVGIEITEE